MAVETNWKVFLSEDSELPPDVSFYIRGDDEDGGKRFRAHKLLLAGVSPVFRQQFFGPMKDTEEVVEVEETTPEAFETMLNYIYKPPGKDTFSLNKIDCQKLFELLALARKYMIPNLETVALTALDTLAIRRENMIFTATVATKYKRRCKFQEFLVNHCANDIFIRQCTNRIKTLGKSLQKTLFVLLSLVNKITCLIAASHRLCGQRSVCKHACEKFVNPDMQDF